MLRYTWRLRLSISLRTAFMTQHIGRLTEALFQLNLWRSSAILENYFFGDVRIDVFNVGCETSSIYVNRMEIPLKSCFFSVVFSIALYNTFTAHIFLLARTLLLNRKHQMIWWQHKKLFVVNNNSYNRGNANNWAWAPVHCSTYEWMSFGKDDCWHITAHQAPIVPMMICAELANDKKIEGNLICEQTEK